LNKQHNAQSAENLFDAPFYRIAYKPIAKVFSPLTHRNSSKLIFKKVKLKFGFL